MSISPVPILFWIMFFVLLSLCGIFHFHGIKGLAASGGGAALFVLLTRPWWKRGFGPMKRPLASFRDPAMGSRAQRRADQRRAAKRPK
ncbi:MAG: hypothetical protein EON56_03725 [Alphaproteobacteria bacterium]|nr:MAG: hypothetical protein EON56_03725 [Alphaproteobacteria bacterium]